MAADIGPDGVDLGPDLGLDLGPDAASTPDGWHVARGFLRDKQGRAVIMRGANLAQRHKWTPYFDYHTEQDYVDLRRIWGFNAVRYLVTWAAVEPQKGTYDSAYLDKVATRMAWARRAGLLVVVDMHQDLFGEGFANGGGDGAPKWACDAKHYQAFTPKSPWFVNYASAEVMACFDGLWTSSELQSHLVDAWRRVAARLVGFDNIVGFDILNEPHWGSAAIYDFEQQHLQPFYDKVIAAVHSAAPGWVPFVEPSLAHSLGVDLGLKAATAGQSRVYAPHLYDSAAEQGAGFSAKQRAFLIRRMKEHGAEARRLGMALWLGEYGGNPDHKGIDAYMDAMYDGAAAVGGSTMYWHAGRDKSYGMYGTDGKPRKGLADVLIRPYPARLAGDPIEYTFDEKTRIFTVSYKGVVAKEPSEIVVPASVYPRGYRVDCGGCDYRKLGDRLLVDRPGKADPVVLTLSPSS